MEKNIIRCLFVIIFFLVPSPNLLKQTFACTFESYFLKSEISLRIEFDRLKYKTFSGFKILEDKFWQYNSCYYNK